MKFAIKLIITLTIIICSAQIGKKLPSLAGLIATMPLTSLLVLLWLYADNSGDYSLMTAYTRGVLWGIIPTVLFFLTALFCFQRKMPLSAVLSISFAVWGAGAIVHQYLLRD